jgi:hypothetical protein
MPDGLGSSATLPGGEIGKQIPGQFAPCTVASSDLDFMKHGVAQARRGWLSAADVVNTRGLADLRQFLKRT